MTDRPIIFSSPMILALLSGQKSMTRRLATSPLRRVTMGDRLWCREAWRVGRRYDATKPADLKPRTMTVLFGAGGSIANNDRGEWVPDYLYDDGDSWAGKLRPSIFLPRWAGRLTLEVTAVKIERLQDISEADARAEGVLYVPGHGDITPSELCADPGYSNYLDCRMGFEVLWSSLHGPGAWKQNPKCVCLSFIVHRRNIDAGEPA